MKRKKKTTFTAENTDNYGNRGIFHSRREAFALRALPKIIAAFRRDAPQGRLQKAENTSCKLYTEQPHTAGYLRAEPDYKGYADRRYRGGRDRHEAGIHPGTDAP